MMRAWLFPLLLLSVSTTESFGQAPFTIETVKGTVTASWKGDAATILETAPTDEQVAALAAYPEIQEISISGCTSLTGTGFAALKELPNLRSIRFNGAGPERFSVLFNGKLDGYRALAELDQLTSLYLGHVKVPVEGAVTLVKGLPNLVDFLPGVAADDQIIVAIMDAPTLQRVSFGHWATVPESQVTMAGFSHYAFMKSLESLSTGSVPPADGSPRQMLETLGQMEGLTNLQVAFGGRIVGGAKRGAESAEVTAEDLALLASLPKLESLQIAHVRITEGGLQGLAALPALKRLTLNGVEYAETDLAALQAARPEWKIAPGK